MEYNKNTVNGEDNISESNLLFEYMDKYKDGYITYEEFENRLKENGLCVDSQDIQNLFEEFDTNADGKIAFDEFYSPNKMTREALVEVDEYDE